MARYPLGQPVTIPVTVKQRNADGTFSLVDAATVTTVVKIANADGTSTTTGTYTSPAHDSTGTYHQDVPAADLTVLGHYQFAVTTTGSGAGVTFGEFDVFDPFETAVLPLQDGKDALNIPQATTTYDSELQQYIATIGTSLEAITGGPLVNRSITERAELDATGTVLQLGQRPVVSVTSITPVATGIAADLSGGLDIDADTAIVRGKSGLAFATGGTGVVIAVYVAGWGVAVPATFNVVSRIILQHLWKTQHGPSARPSMGGEDLISVAGFPYAIPRGASELLNGTLNGMPFKPQVFA